MRTTLVMLMLALASVLLGGCGCMEPMPANPEEANPSCSSSPYGMTEEVPSFKEGGLGWR